MSGEAPAEQALIARAARGDREAFDDLIAPRWDRIYRIALRVIGDTGEAQDVAQKTCLKLWETLPRFRLGEDLDGWIYRMTVNQAVDALRRRRARPDHPASGKATEPDPRLAAGAPGPLELLMAHELESALDELTRDLPERQKAVFVLTRIEGFDVPAVAEMLGIAPSTVRNHLFQVRAVLARRLRERHPGLLGDVDDDAGGDERSSRAGKK